MSCNTGTVAQQRIDIDGELRPSTAPDIGVDQFNDSDSDELADQWELEYAGNQTTLTGRSQDSDGDGLSNESEYANGTAPVVADTDGDGISDGDEVLVHGSNPLSTDTDGDDMPDDWELAHGLALLAANAFDDGDGDRYPNVFEYTYSTDPSNSASTPTPTYLVNGAGGGTHTTIGAALTAASVANGAYQIIGIAPGVYTGTANLRSSVTVSSTKPKLLLIGLQGAAETIIDGGGANQGWLFQNSAVISSLTFRNTSAALYVQTPANDVRFVDLIVRDNTASGSNHPTPGLHVASMATGGKVYVVGVDQFNDFDSDGLPDAWELANVGDTTSMVGSADDDNDQLSNSAEYDLETHWLDPDMDQDGLLDGSEVALGTNPFVADSEDMTSDLNQDGLIDSIGAQLGYQPNQLDSDGDSVSNADELLMGTNPLRVDSDGDGVPDGTDPFPLDPLVSSLPSDPQDLDPPVITLTAPWYAVEQ